MLKGKKAKEVVLDKPEKKPKEKEKEKEKTKPEDKPEKKTKEKEKTKNPRRKRRKKRKRIKRKPKNSRKTQLTKPNPTDIFHRLLIQAHSTTRLKHLWISSLTRAVTPRKSSSLRNILTRHDGIGFHQNAWCRFFTRSHWIYNAVVKLYSARTSENFGVPVWGLFISNVLLLENVAEMADEKPVPGVSAGGRS